MINTTFSYSTVQPVPYKLGVNLSIPHTHRVNCWCYFNSGVGVSVVCGVVGGAIIIKIQ